jgi:hypothetical protein
MKFLIDRDNEEIVVNGKRIPFAEFVDAAGKDGKSAYEIWLEIPGNAGKSIYDFIAFMEGQNGLDGEDAYNVIIESNIGNFFKNYNGVAILTCTITKGGRILTDTEHNMFNYVWRLNGQECLLNEQNEVVGRYTGGGIPGGLHISRGVSNASNAKYVKVGSEDVMNKANITCDVLTK